MFCMCVVFYFELKIKNGEKGPGQGVAVEEAHGGPLVGGAAVGPVAPEGRHRSSESATDRQRGESILVMKHISYIISIF